MVAVYMSVTTYLEIIAALALMGFIWRMMDTTVLVSRNVSRIPSLASDHTGEVISKSTMLRVPWCVMSWSLL